MNAAVKTIRIADLALILHRTERTIAEDVSRRPESLPPRLLIPNSKTVLWRMIDVEKWLEDRVQKPIGRPRKAA